MQMNFAECVQQQAIRYGERRFYTFLNGRQGASGQQTLSYSALNEAGCRLASWLAQQSLAHHPVLLLYPPGLDFIKAFVGCLYAKVVAVPAPLPNDPNSMQRIIGIMADADIRLVLTTTALVDSLQEKLSQNALDKVFCMATDVELPGSSNEWRLPAIDASDVALLQYTSGSTSDPKGVMITHDNLQHNQANIGRITSGCDQDVIVGWLPHFHDMGLIGMLLHPLYLGSNCVFMSPMTFLKRPIRWLEAITQYRASITVAPDFAYELCARVIGDDELKALDLSSLRVALNGAEPIRYRTLENFARRFKAIGFEAKTFSPCYGMAESTLIVTGKAPNTEPVFFDTTADAMDGIEVRASEQIQRSVRLVSSGRVVATEIRIVDPQNLDVLHGDRIGEIWLKGRSIARGYWKQPKSSADSFGAMTVDGDGPYLRTGDLGFVKDGELYVTGRLKDLLIINGRNIYPQDIEYFVKDLHSVLNQGTSVAFQAAQDEISIVLIQEIINKTELKEISLEHLDAHIKSSVAKVFGIPSLEVFFAKRGAVRRTTSGKVQRNLMRSLYLNNELIPFGTQLANNSVDGMQDREQEGSPLSA